MRIKAIVPIVSPIYNDLLLSHMSAVKAPGTELTMVGIRNGPESIECAYDENLCLPDTLNEVEKAEKEGYDSVLIMCATDPGLQAAREILKIPIAGILESSIHLAAMLSRKFSIVTVVRDIVPLFEDRVKLFGMESRLASVRAVEIPVLELEKDPRAMHDALYDESRKAIEEDGADAIVLGCAGMMGVAKTLTQELGVPVIDPDTAGVKMAELLVGLGLTHSKKTYMRPREKKRTLNYGLAAPQ